MPKVVLCQDGLVADLENENGLWITLTDASDGAVGRFAIDPAEFRAVLEGRFSFQVTNGEGSSVNIDGAGGTLKVRLTGKAHGVKQCRLSAESVEEAMRALNIGV